MVKFNNKYPDIEQLIDRIACGDDVAFKIIYDSFSGKMFRLCLRMMEGRHMDAEDCFQEGCVRLYKNIRSYRGDGSFEGWVRMIFLNCCMSHYRLRGRDITCLTDASFENRNTDMPNALDVLYAKDIINHLQHNLPDGRKKIVRLYCIDGYQHTEIAQLLGCSESNCKSQLHRARKRLALSIPYN
ncbi:MAG: sigma-70 family RNA polymerase sigma factor [Bacteroidetes bacterium]|nr:sigma-70 family RNA polymerase sigma factor [Bacteroidota bacterium]